MGILFASWWCSSDGEDGSCASDEWKGCFQWAEGTFLMSGSGASDGWKDGRDWGQPYTELVDTGDYKITGLHPVFCALDF